MAINSIWNTDRQFQELPEEENEAPARPADREAEAGLQDLERSLAQADELEDFETHDNADLVYREYDPLMVSNLSDHYQRFDRFGQSSWKTGRPTTLMSWLHCISCVAQTNFLAGTFVGSILALVVYLDVNLADICYSYREDTAKIPVSINRIKTVSDMISGMVVQSWHFVTLFFVFGWPLIREVNILSWNILAALLEGIYKLISGIYLIRSEDWSMYPSYGIFIILTFFNSIAVAKHFQRSYRGAKLLVLKLAGQFLVGIPTAFIFIVWINPMYKSMGVLEKVVFASFVPIIVAIPKMLARKSVLSISRINHPGSSVYLLSAMYTSMSFLYRFLQVQIDSIGPFLILSVVFCIESTIERVSLPYLDLLQSNIFRNSQGIAEFMTPRRKRLMADIYLLNMIMEPVAIIVSCTSMATLMYLYGHSTQGETYNFVFLFKVALTRILSAIAIEFFFNIISTKVETFYFNMPVNRVWRQKRKWLVLTALVNAIIAILCFSKVFYQALSSQDMFDGTIICSGPFQRPSIKMANITELV